MSKFSSFGVLAVSALLGAAACPIWAQTDTQPPATQPPAAPAPPASPVQTATPAQTPPPADPKFLENGGLSIEPFYWFNKKQPSLAGGVQALGYGNFGYTGDAKASLGGEIGIPAGRSNTLWVSYFRSQGNANATIGTNTVIFSETYSPGDYVSANYLLQSAKISWDYLSYTWHKPSMDIHLRTLYEVQYVNIGTNFVAPFKAVTTDATTGTTDYNTATGSKNLIYPTLGMAVGSALGKYFRWEVKGSGFGLPHLPDIWDAQATVGVRIGSFEIVAGEERLPLQDIA